MAIREEFRRARSDHEKEARRIEILEAAEDMLLKSGNERFAVSALAARVKVSKSTVFLYFGNKEEMLLAVYERAFLRVLGQVEDRLTPGMSGKDLAVVFIDSMTDHPAMLMLRAYLARTIERNVPLESMVSTRKRLLDRGIAVTKKMDEVMDLESGNGMRMLMSLVNLAAGALQVDALPYVDAKDVPQEIADLLHTAAIRNIFMDGAEFIFRGATGRPFE